jgi:hypothetical protein
MKVSPMAARARRVLLKKFFIFMGRIVGEIKSSVKISPDPKRAFYKSSIT